eukprot:PhM_4_TR16134/c1_g1_i2/m.88198
MVPDVFSCASKLPHDQRSSMCFMDNFGVLRECTCPIASCVVGPNGTGQCQWTDLSYLVLALALMPWVYYLAKFVRVVISAVSAPAKQLPDDEPLMGVYRVDTTEQERSGHFTPTAGARRTSGGTF